MSAPVASDTRSPLRASRETRACSVAVPSPAATSGAPTSLRSSPVVWGFVVDPGPADVDGRGVLQQEFLDGVLVQARDGGQPPGDRGACPVGGFEVAGEELDVGPPDGEQGQVAAVAPGELAQVHGVGLEGQAGLPGQESV